MSRKRERAKANFEQAKAENQTAFDQMNYAASELFRARQKAVETIKHIEMFLNGISNIPAEFLETIERVKSNRQKFETSVQTAKTEVEKLNEPQGNSGVAVAGFSVATAGVIAAVGGPTAAVAIATTFGVASTGAAISSLSGAAMTSAALAWLGGGAIAAGGAGIAGGIGVLIAISVIGVAFAGLTITATGVLSGIMDRNITAEYKQNALFLREATKMWNDNKSAISALSMEILQTEIKIEVLLELLMSAGKNFSEWNDNQKQYMRDLMARTDDLSNKLLVLIPIDLTKCDQVEYYKKRLIALSQLPYPPESPHFLFGIKKTGIAKGFGWVDIATADDWKLQFNKNMIFYRILDPVKKEVAYGNKEEINEYLDSIMI